jgi:hypothetical protein
MTNNNETFLIDINKEALKDLDRRLATFNSPESGQIKRRQEDAYAAPYLSQDIAPPAEFPVKNAQSDQPDGATDFLAELEHEVAIQNQLDAANNGLGSKTSREKAQLLHESLFSIFSFFNKMSRHANLLAPEILRSYRLDSQTAYSGLRWKGAFADCRKQDTSERSLLAHVSFRVRLVAPEPIPFVRRWDQLDTLKKELHMLNLRTVDEFLFPKKAEQEFVEMELAPDFPVQISFQGNYAADRIDVLSRNLEGFGIAAFTLDRDRVDQSMLEGLGRFLMSRSDKLPDALRRITYVPSEKKTLKDSFSF